MPRDEVPLDPIAVAVDFAGRLERLGIRYVIGGSLAASVHGEPRTTMDVDLVADLRTGQVEAFGKGLDGAYYVDLDVARDATTRGGSFNAIHLTSAVKVDIFVAGSDLFEAERLARRMAVRVSPDEELWMDTPEHTILRKLEWYRRGDQQSDRQWRDVQAIVAVQGAGLDRDVLDRWAARLGVRDLVDRLLQNARG